jgi:hypothetical protein
MKILKGFLESKGDIKVFELVSSKENTPTEYYEEAMRNCVEKAHIIIAECSHVTFDMGWQLGTAVKHFHKRVSAFIKKDGKITKFSVGAAWARNLNYSLNMYNDLDELRKFCLKDIKDFRGY